MPGHDVIILNADLKRYIFSITHEYKEKPLSLKCDDLIVTTKRYNSSLHTHVAVFNKDSTLFVKVDFSKPKSHGQIEREDLLCHLTKHKDNFKFMDMETKTLITDKFEIVTLTKEILTYSKNLEVPTTEKKCSG